MTLNHDDARPFPGLSRIGALLADPGRAAMLWSLMDGTARPAGELTMIAGISPSAASGHFARLVESGLLKLEVSGRHRYYRIATPDIAMAIEALANLAQASAPLREAAQRRTRKPPRPALRRTARDALRPDLLRPSGGRTCRTAVRSHVELEVAGSHTGCTVGNTAARSCHAGRNIKRIR